MRLHRVRGRVRAPPLRGPRPRPLRLTQVGKRYVAAMTRRVICISRLVGAGGAEVGRLVAENLRYRLVDEEIVQQAAESSGVSVDELADAERRTKVIDRLTRNLAVAGGAAGLMTVGGPGDFIGGAAPQTVRAPLPKNRHQTAGGGGG